MFPFPKLASKGSTLEGQRTTPFLGGSRASVDLYFLRVLLHFAGEQHLFLGKGTGKDKRYPGAKGDYPQINQGEIANRDTKSA
jgi:hypothetical protein